MLATIEDAAPRAAQKVDDADVVLTPFPHIIVDGIFDDAFYEQILPHLPPLSLLSIPNKFGMMKIEEDDAALRASPDASRAFWRTFDTDVKGPISAALLRKFRPYLDEKLSLIFGDGARPAEPVRDDEFRPLRGIVQCRTTGARMGAHIDKATSLFTYLFYFAADDSLRPYGTIFYEAADRAKLVQMYRDNRSIRAWFPSADQLRDVGLTPHPPIEFRRNRLVAYANLPYSLHGAATEASMPRYSMQSFCDIPARIALPLFDGWRDTMSPTEVYRGDI